uniref:LRRNT domain-containing protein n=1 Tax=Heterorhabditis bacteriophora TaxID=37862 RepID=A0A1I7X9P6_HETBA
MLVRGRVVVLLALYTASTVAQCPALSAPCRCTPSIYEPVAIICENAGSLSNALQAIQSARDIPIDSLMIMDTAISSIPANAFQSFKILRLVLNRNTLQNIDDQAFNGPLLDSLVELDLNDNNLGQIPQMGVPRLRNLRKLYLNRNRINTLSSNGFASYESKDLIIKLSLAGNRLTDQTLGETAVFRPLRMLQELSLETNTLTSIPSSALVNQRTTLTNLNLGLNTINEVPVGALDFPSLTSLSLEFNGITVIPPQAFQGVPNLQYLYLTGNKFPSWTPEMYRYITQLRTLGIGETPISVIPNNAFLHISNLIRLEMSEAAIDTIERGAFQKIPHIQAIVLNKNRLSQ